VILYGKGESNTHHLREGLTISPTGSLNRLTATVSNTHLYWQRVLSLTSVL